MNRVTGGGLPARIWADFMTAALAGIQAGVDAHHDAVLTLLEGTDANTPARRAGVHSDIAQTLLLARRQGRDGSP